MSSFIPRLYFQIIKRIGGSPYRYSRQPKLLADMKRPAVDGNETNTHFTQQAIVLLEREGHRRHIDDTLPVIHQHRVTSHQTEDILPVFRPAQYRQPVVGIFQHPSAYFQKSVVGKLAYISQTATGIIDQDIGAVILICPRLRRWQYDAFRTCHLTGHVVIVVGQTGGYIEWDIMCVQIFTERHR